CEAKKRKRIRRPPVMQMRPALFHWGFSVTPPSLFKAKLSRRSENGGDVHTDGGVLERFVNGDLEGADGLDGSTTAELYATDASNKNAQSVLIERRNELDLEEDLDVPPPPPKKKNKRLKSKGKRKKKSKTQGRRRPSLTHSRVTAFRPLGADGVEAFRPHQNFIGGKSANYSVNSNGTLTDKQIEENRSTTFAVVSSIVLIIVGLAFLFAGFAIFKPALFFSGFFLFVLLSVAIMNAVQNGTKKDINSTIFFGVAAVAGVIGGLIFLCVWKAGLFALGAILGFVIAAVILSFVSNGSIAPGAGRVAFIVAMSIVFGVLLLFFERWLYIIATAIPGAYAIVLGVDCFANVGFKDAAVSFLGRGTFQTSPKLWGLIALFVILSIFGLTVQTILYHRRKRRQQARAVKEEEQDAEKISDEEKALLNDKEGQAELPPYAGGEAMVVGEHKGGEKKSETGPSPV
ncbi:hypothetical protein HDU67_002249, partial [Dinochytrium kinnereticum]